ncbi:putative sugar transporter [Talaromyces proteolyticus]|uniref:Sugar transporter n=1 Tax=Talaromyces proteolyticus TaxID=1131652 RepID=A0AAD4KL35_9EURO|nr:putative sugar transporter [Talaromyces proteolyticus]KAH8690868.1 putative sugar transporter [Talaromyces proteolyticus]
MGIHWTVYLYGIAPCMGGLAFGYDTGSMSGILAMPQFLNYMDNPSNFLQGGMTASIQAGAFAGSLLTGAFLADKIGRRKTILFGSALFTIGIIISTVANGVAALVAGRVINGLGNGCLAMMVPNYQSEIAPREIRGRIISVQQCFINFGILVAFWIQYGTSHIDGQAAWRIPIGIQMVPTIILHITFYFMPESPRWLVQQDRLQDALQALAKVHSRGDTSDPYVKAEMAEIVAKIEWEKRNPPITYAAMLFGLEARRTWLAIGVQLWQQVTGINVIMYYAVFLFQQAGLGSTSSSLLANGLQGVILNIFTLPDMYFMDKWGRRIPMIIGGFGMGVAMMLIGVIMKTTGDPIYDSLTKKTNFHFADQNASNACIAFVYIYVMVFALTWACVAWVYPPELFSMNMRGRGTSLSSATNWFVNFWFALYIPTAMDKISWKLYIIFMALCYVMATVVYFFYPESAGKTLEEMDFLFTKDRTPWVFRDPEAKKIGAIFERDMAHGQALTAFDSGKATELTHVETVAGVEETSTKAGEV